MRQVQKDNMEKNLSVPYKSQWDNDAVKTANDCGASAIAMILNFFGENLTTDRVYELTGAGKGLISISQLQTALTSLGYTSSFEQNQNPQILKSYIDLGLPVIALVHYGSLNSVQDKNFKGGHFFTVVGYRDDGYFVNDPNFQGKFRQDGDHHFYTKAEFEKAWEDCNIDKNPVRSFIVITPKQTIPAAIPQTRNVVVTSDAGANIRTTPSVVGKNVKTSVKKGTGLAVDGYVEGEAVDGNKYWWKMKGENLYVSATTTNVQPVIAKIEATQPSAPLSTKTREELEAELKTKTEDLKRIALNDADKAKYIEQLQIDMQKLKDTIFQNEETVKEIKTYKTTNEELSKHLEQQSQAYLTKMGELKADLAAGKAEAFKGWTLIEIPAGSNALTRVPILVTQLMTLTRDIMKNGYVVGWKKGGKLVRVDTAPAVAGQSVSKLLQ